MKTRRVSLNKVHRRVFNTNNFLSILIRFTECYFKTLSFSDYSSPERKPINMVTENTIKIRRETRLTHETIQGPQSQGHKLVQVNGT